MQPKPLDRSKVRALIAEAELSLADSPHPERARQDAEALLLHVLGRSAPDRNRAWLVAHWNSPTLPKVGTEYRALVGRRLRGEPMQYITGEQEFYGLPFRVTPDVLIPRPETEVLVERILEWTAGRGAPLRIVDVGAGAGAIAVALAHHLPKAQITAIDLSAAALEIARENACRNETAIRFLHGDLLAPVAGERFDIVVSNPPYVAATDRASLSVEVRDHEPPMALFAGNDGLDIYRRLLPAAWRALEPRGLLALEFGYGQDRALADMLAGAGFYPVRIFPDLQSIPRVVFGWRPEAACQTT